jgi:hypothetical protein
VRRPAHRLPLQDLNPHTEEENVSNDIGRTPAPMDRIRAWLTENGFREGRHGSCRHLCGLPRIDAVRVRPEYSPVDGDHMLLVTPDRVIQAVCPYPWGQHDWYTLSVTPYATTEELGRVLTRLAKKPTGCWG